MFLVRALLAAVARVFFMFWLVFKLSKLAVEYSPEFPYLVEPGSAIGVKYFPEVMKVKLENWLKLGSG